MIIPITVMIMTIKIKDSLITLVMRILKNIIHIQQKTRNMSVKKGQFEGFYVESVGFCKLKIAQGRPGPQGIQGRQSPIGPNGTQGRPGPQGQSVIITLKDTSNYIVNSFFTEVNPSSDECVFAICDIENSISIGYDTDPNKGFKLEGMFNLFLHQ